MILTCPACTMRYLVAEGAVGSEGRRVRCAHCGHQWFQEPETGLDEALFGHDEPDLDHVFVEEDDDLPFERTAHRDDEDTGADFHSILQRELEGTPIPEGVKPVHVHEDITLPKPSKRKKVGKVPPEKLGGFATAAVFWAVVLGALLVAHPQISRAWPASNLLYSMVGLKPVPPGEGLSLDGLRAEMAAGKIRLLGDIINLKEGEAKVPAVMASIVDAEGKEIDRILIAPPVARLKPEGRVSFDAVYPKIPDGAANVNYAFSLVKVKAEKEELEEKPPEKGAPPTEIKAEEKHADDHADEAPQHPAPHH